MRSVTSKPEGSPSENELFAYQRMIRAVSKDSLILATFARADLAHFLNDDEGVRGELQPLINDSSSVFAPEALWIMANWALADNGHDADLRSFLERWPDHSRAEEGWLLLGIQYETEGKMLEASLCYETIIVEHPDGLLTSEARFRLDQISGIILPPLLPEPILGL